MQLTRHESNAVRNDRGGQCTHAPCMQQKLRLDVTSLKFNMCLTIAESILSVFQCDNHNQTVISAFGTTRLCSQPKKRNHAWLTPYSAALLSFSISSLTNDPKPVPDDARQLHPVVDMFYPRRREGFQEGLGKSPTTRRQRFVRAR